MVPKKTITKIVFKLYFFKEKRLLLLFLLVVQSFWLFAQEDKAIRNKTIADTVNIISDTLIVPQDTVSIDTLIRKPAKGGIDSKITYKSVELIKRDLIKKQFILVKNAVIDYQDIEVKADSIVINMETNLLFAIGRKDTTGKVTGKPSFKQGSNAFESDELTYNFKTKKALIKNIVTKQDAGLLHSQFTKLLEDGTSNISHSTYSTCNADTPHFYINLPKAKVFPGKKIISGPGNLVVEGIPLPLAIPFAFIPIQTKRAASGILIPRYGEERVRGFSLSDGGYYFAINDYFDLALKGSVYANGSWIATGQTDYKRLYRYSGNFSFSYADNIAGHQGLQDFSESKNYRVAWIYAQDPKASPGSRFSASVNMSSSGYDQNNSYNVSDHVTTQRQSSVSYSKSWDGTPFNFSISANHSQNVRNKTVSLDLPKASLNMSRIYPFKSKNSSGKPKWYEEIQLSYTASLDNQIDTRDTLLFTSAIWKNMKNGFKQDMPLSIQINPFKNFSISPSITYSGVMYSQKIVKVFDPVQNVAVNDTLHGLFYGQAVNPTISTGFNPQLFGMYTFNNPNSRLQSIRHVIKPSVTFSFTPAFSGLSSKLYRQVQVDQYGTNLKYSVFDGNIFGTPSLSQKSGNVNFNIVNIVEGKIFEKNDTTGKPKKIKLIDNLSIGTSYNIFADQFKWAPVAIDMRTTIMNNISLSARSAFSLYGLDSVGNAIDKFLYKQDRKLMRLTSFSTGIDFSLSDLFKKNKEKGKTGGAQNALSQGLQQPGQIAQNTDQISKSGVPGQEINPSGPVALDKYGYPIFNLPWTLNMSYSLSYTNTGRNSTLNQYLTFNGSATITKKMSATFTSGYDFAARAVTVTNIGITRDLHCWMMSLNWVPNGYLASWSFTIRVKASVLGDLKYERRKDFHDTY